jgi:hypothetical protein
MKDRDAVGAEAEWLLDLPCTGIIPARTKYRRGRIGSSADKGIYVVLLPHVLGRKPKLRLRE